jgi:hypothetical protein
MDSAQFDRLSRPGHGPIPPRVRPRLSRPRFCYAAASFPAWQQKNRRGSLWTANGSMP